MAKPQETRHYGMADADLKQMADNLIDSIERDAADFVTRNITSGRVKAFAELITTFDDSSTDEELQGQLSADVISKDDLAENIRKAIRQIRNMAEIQYQGRGKYKTFGFEDMANFSDSDLHRMTKRVLRMANTLMPELAVQGLTGAQITALDQMNQDLDAAIDTVASSSETRDIATQDRIEKGNALWEEMGTLASIGQSLYADTNEAKYNDYVLVDGPGEPPVPPAP